MALTVCLAANALGYEQGGGHLWAYLNWALGLRGLGCEVLWLEAAPAQSAEELVRQVEALRGQLASFGLADRLAIHGSPVRAPADTLDDDSLAEADLLLNLGYDVSGPLVKRFRRSVLVDIDPGATQLWMAAGLLELASHDAYFTTGEGIASGSARLRAGDFEWRYTPPCVALDQWPVRPLPTDAAYTTVTHWWADEGEDWIEIEGRWVENTKRIAYAPLLDLPGRVGVPLELALGGVEDDNEVRSLQDRGWSVCDAWEVAGSPEAFRAYVSGSRGEFSAAKPAYVRLRSGWFSDRTACYLASGRPAVVEWTGPSRLLSDNEGMARFRTVEEAARALASVEADYEQHSRRAREFAERHLDARLVVGRVLEDALA